MDDHQVVENILHAQGYDDFKWIHPQQIVVSQWVRMKCQFGCSSYGKVASCPPNLPSVEECQRFFTEYRDAVVIHIQHSAPEPAARRTWSARTNIKLGKMEREVFLAGYRKAFLLFMDSCEICADCVPDKADCKQPELSRPTAEGLAVDVYTTVRKLGFPIEVLTDTSQVMNRYAFLMVE